MTTIEQIKVEPNLSGIVAFGETLDTVKELIEDFEEPIEIC